MSVCYIYSLPLTQTILVKAKQGIVLVNLHKFHSPRIFKHAHNYTLQQIDGRKFQIYRPPRYDISTTHPPPTENLYKNNGYLESLHLNFTYSGNAPPF